ncbi:uncharacterized protein VTP21DRAFT_4208 [Calcarisporiella thermophila]|uniref:uncharacterized protein n=1 Tax=Calcarisporiella thermophila TaxID=911321 RepID=UPI0037435D8E
MENLLIKGNLQVPISIARENIGSLSDKAVRSEKSATLRGKSIRVASRKKLQGVPLSRTHAKQSVAVVECLKAILTLGSYQVSIDAAQSPHSCARVTRAPKRMLVGLSPLSRLTPSQTTPSPSN